MTPSQALSLLAATALFAGPVRGQSCPTSFDTNPTGSGLIWTGPTPAVGGDFTLFPATNGTQGIELFRWDPASGATLVKDIQPGPLDSYPYNFHTAYLQGQLLTFFVADDGVHGTELFRTDGTPAGTFLFQDINAGPGGSSPGFFFFHPDLELLFFAANDGVNGKELWSTDGTPFGTSMVADLHPTGGTGWDEGMGRVGGFVLFGADNGIDGLELHRSDGTAAGTTMLKDINPATTPWGTGASSSPGPFHPLDGSRTLFGAREDLLGGELYITDGTAAGTSLLLDINPGAASSSPRAFINFGGEVYFVADDGTHGSELWKTDGTALGTVLVVDSVPGPDGIHSPDISKLDPTLVVSGDRIFFASNHSSTSGIELWSSDGTAAGTSLVADIAPGTASSKPEWLFAARNGVYFEAQALNGRELFFSDGSAAGTVEVCDLFPGASSGSPFGFTLCAGALLFGATTPSMGTELHALLNVGAYSADLGSPGFGSPRLASSAPLLGANLTFEATGLAPGAASFLVVSGHTGSPDQLLCSSYSVNWLDVFTANIFGVFVPPAWTTWSSTHPVPASPTFVGIQLNAQVWSLPGGGFPAETTNGLHLVLGN
ncbi:MAG: hypothetical protein P1V81_15120 [Planctomycetota bacterium]|nr:hypothetical protein [Planctomycetota bacterium]